MTKKLTKAIAGPWRQDPAYVSAEQGVSRGWNIHDGNGQFVCTISNCHENGQQQTDLIAAAPELLKALQAMHTQMTHFDAAWKQAGVEDIYEEVVSNAEKAMAKAEGRPS